MEYSDDLSMVDLSKSNKKLLYKDQIMVMFIISISFSILKKVFLHLKRKMYNISIGLWIEVNKKLLQDECNLN